MCDALCALGAPPPYDLPPPPDPSLVWPELFDAADSLPSTSGGVAEASAFLELAQQHSRRHSVERQSVGAIAHATCQAFRLTSVDDVSSGGGRSVILRAIGSIWSDAEGGDVEEAQAWTKGQYALLTVFTLLLLGCFAAILALRRRRRRHSSAADDSPTRKNRLKSQRSTPSLNSSKLSTETVGTATATMIASVGSGGGGPYRYAINNSSNISSAVATTVACGNAAMNEAGCYGTHRTTIVQHHRNRPSSQVPLPYHSATISRRMVVPPSLQCHHHHHHHGSMNANNSGSCSGGMTNYGVNHSGSIQCCEDGNDTMMPCCSGCCGPNNNYQQQQLLNNNNNGRIYNSQSATNIFGPNGLALTPSQCTHPSSAIMRSDAQRCSINNDNGGPYQRCSSTLLRGSARPPPRCAALRINSPPGTTNNIDHNNAQEQQLQQYHQRSSLTNNNDNISGSQSTLPYDYETIDNGSVYGTSNGGVGGGHLFYYDPISSTVVPTTVHRPTMVHTYVDTSNHCDGGSKTTIFEDLSENLRYESGGAANNANLQRHPPPSSRPPPPPLPNRRGDVAVGATILAEQQPPQRTSPNDSASSSAASISSTDTELRQLIAVVPKVTETMYTGARNVYDPTCDDASSSFSPNDNADEQLSTAVGIDNCGGTPPPHQRITGRESGYGTGRSRRGGPQNRLNLAPVDDTAVGGENKSPNFLIVSNETKPIHFHHQKQSQHQPSMTYV